MSNPTVVVIDSGVESKHDAERCISALRKRFPGFEFYGLPSNKRGAFLIRSQPWAHDHVLFAEGFMASASLWER